jgi:hypothetical protein
MRLYEFDTKLDEDVGQPYLYHWMELSKAIKVLQSNCLKPLFAHKQIGERGISMTRNPRYLHNWVEGSVPLRLTFDRNVLKQRFKIIPLDSEHARYKPGKHFQRNYDSERTDRAKSARWRDEPMAEEYVIGTIQPLHKYIVEMRFDNWGNDNNPFMLTLLSYLKKYPVPFNVTQDIKNWEMWVDDFENAEWIPDLIKTFRVRIK